MTTYQAKNLLQLAKVEDKTMTCGFTPDEHLSRRNRSTQAGRYCIPSEVDLIVVAHSAGERMQSVGSSSGSSSSATCNSRCGATFDEFYRSERVRAIGLAYALNGDRYHAEDITQDAFIAAYRSWHIVAAKQRPDMWLNRVICNKSVSLFRKRMNEAKALLRFSQHKADFVTLDEDDLAFWREVRALPRRQSQAIALYYVNDMSVAQIAEVLECSENSVKTHLFRGRLAVAKALELEEL